MVSNMYETFDTFRFSVVIDGVHYATFEEFSMPSFQVETMEIKEGGQNAYVRKLPVRVSVGNATLRHGSTHDLKLLNWYLEIVKGNVKKATRHVTVVMYDTTRKPIITWGFREAFPVKWSGPRFKADDHSVAIEEIEFVHHGFEVS